jgi:hypothetical protein
MLVYNISIKVNHAILSDWIKWQTEEHIPEIMATALFDEYKFFRLLETDETEGPTFVIQYFTNARKNYDEYILKHATQLRKKALQKWGNGFIAFRTLLESVQ